jgi:hypothetical protein
MFAMHMAGAQSVFLFSVTWLGFPPCSELLKHHVAAAAV